MVIIYQKNFSDLFSSQKVNNSYSDIERELIKVTHNYTDNYYYKVLENGDSDYITVKGLQEEGLITNVVDIKKIHCSGYIHFYKEEGITHYDPYIKCGDNYTTKGYQSSHDVAVD